jgi:hypothetical protein
LKDFDLPISTNLIIEYRTYINTFKDYPTLPKLDTMKYTSNEIDYMLFRNDLELYERINNIVKLRIDTIDEDRLSILLGRLLDLNTNISLYSKMLKSKEMYI